MTTEVLKYVQFPLLLLKDIHTNKTGTLNDILTYGIYHFSKKFKVELRDVARQIVYEYYRGILSYEIRSELDSMDRDYLGYDDTYNGFSGSTFEPDDEITEMLELMEKNPHLNALCIEFYQVHLARESLPVINIPAKGMTGQTIERGRQIERLIPKGEPLPMVSVLQVFEFRDNDRSELDLMQFLASIAVRSIIGQKAYCKTTKKLIICRMFGYKSINSMPDELSEPVRTLFSKYSHRYHIDRLLQKLELYWGIYIYGNNMRGFYIAIKNRITLEKLVLIAETRKEKARIEGYKARKAAATLKALEQLKNKGNNTAL